jgi:osmotically-inducible protein OsmY
VKSALLGAEGLRSLEISVQTYKGKVQLTGFVDAKVQIAQAGKIVASESGVKSVLNDLTLK